MKTGCLPRQPPERIWGGPGGGATCVVCGKKVGREEMEFELQFSSPENPDWENCHVHVGCFAAWEVERRNEGSSDQPLSCNYEDGIMGHELRGTSPRGAA